MARIDGLFEEQLIRDSITDAYRKGGGKVDVFIGANFVWNGGGEKGVYTCHIKLLTAEGRRVRPLYIKTRRMQELYKPSGQEEPYGTLLLGRICEMDSEIAENAIEYAEELKGRGLDVTVNGKDIGDSREAHRQYIDAAREMLAEGDRSVGTDLEKAIRAMKKTNAARNSIIVSNGHINYDGSMEVYGSKGGIKVYTSPNCGYCHHVKGFLRQNNLRFEEVDMSASEDASMEAVEKCGYMASPVVDISGKIIIGFDPAAMKEALGL